MQLKNTGNQPIKYFQDGNIVTALPDSIIDIADADASVLCKLFPALRKIEVETITTKPAKIETKAKKNGKSKKSGK